jgi:hypothetical protein
MGAEVGLTKFESTLVREGPSSKQQRPTSLGLTRLSARGVGLLEWTPFEVLLVSPACYRSTGALLTGGFRLVALQTFVLACYTPYAK